MKISALFNARKKKVLIGVGVALLLGVVTSGYLLWLPSKIAHNFTSEAETSYSQVSSAMDKVYASFSSDLFTDLNQSSADAKAEIKDAFNAIAEAGAVLDKNNSKTKLTNLPGASMNSSYKDAKKLNDDQARYFSDARAFLGEYKEVITYMDKMADFCAESESAATELAAAFYASDLDESIKKLDSAIAKLTTVSDNMKALDAPEALAQYREKASKEDEHLLDVLRNLSSAWKAGNAEKATEAATELSTSATQIVAESSKIIMSLQNDSGLAKTIENLRAQQRDLRDSF